MVFKMLLSILLSIELTFRGNHKLVFKNAGFTTIKGYRYWSNDRSIDFAGLIEDLKNAPQKFTLYSNRIIELYFVDLL